jgi:Lamin Tail Domain
VQNAGNVPLAIGFSRPSRFTVIDVQTMNPPLQTTLAPAHSKTLRVAPPPTCAGPQVDEPFNVGAVVSPVTTSSPPMIAGFPVTVQLSACVPVVVKVPPGALRITTIEADAPGDDVLPEGEFIEILNTTSGPLDLTGCIVQDRVVSEAGVPGSFRTFYEFGPAVFGTDSKLPPAQTLRLLTRAKAASDGMRPFVLFAGFKQAVWNNNGDTGRILDENNVVVAELTYVTTQPAPGTALPPGTVVSQPRARTRALVRRVYVDVNMDWTNVFEVQDGDLVIITATGSARFGLFGRQVGPDGAGGPLTPANQGWPLENAPAYALIGSLEGGPPFLVGSTASITFNRNSRPVMLTLGPNDGELWDNAGEFDCVAILYRS